MNKLLKSIVLAGLVIFAGYGLYAAEINDLNVSAGSNTARFPENMARADVNNNLRELEAILARWHKDTNASIVSYGSANAIKVTPNQTISSLYDGLVMAFEVTAANTGAATLQIGSLTAKTLKKYHDQDLASGDLEQGQKVVVVYNSDEDVFQIVGGGPTTVVSGGTGISVSGSSISVALSAAQGLTTSANTLIFDINGLTSAELTGNDTIPIFDASASASRKITSSQILGQIGNLNTVTPVTTDEMVFIDVSDNNNPRKATLDTVLGLKGAAGTTLLAVATASSSATVDLETTSAFDGTYDKIMVEVTGFRPASDTRHLQMQVKVGGSYVSASYQWGLITLDSAGTGTGVLGGNSSTEAGDATMIRLSLSPENTSPANGSFTIKIDNPADTSLYKHVYSVGSFNSSAGTQMAVIASGSYQGGTGALQGLRFLTNSGDIAEGEFRLYGIRKSL